ncbi:hypothetical protein L6R52_36500, partial [Myxococcota bacterium]|nr:hypothetical protein [Myxococcota bacterium]
VAPIVGVARPVDALPRPVGQLARSTDGPTGAELAVYVVSGVAALLTGFAFVHLFRLLAG